MAKKQTLQGAIYKMADGSKQGFSDFYAGTVQFIYRSALLLSGNHEDACRFLVDFYQYLYLHLPEYNKSENLEKWISRLMLARYNELSIGKQLPPQTVFSQLGASTAELSSHEQQRLFRQLQAKIHFPKEPFSIPNKVIVIALPVILLLLLMAYHYAPDIKAYFFTDDTSAQLPEQPADSVEEEVDLPELTLPSVSNEPEEKEEENDEKKEEHDEKPAVRPVPSDDSTVTSPSKQQQNDYTDLENMELHLHYGDNLIRGGELPGND